MMLLKVVQCVSMSKALSGDLKTPQFVSIDCNLLSFQWLILGTTVELERVRTTWGLYKKIQKVNMVGFLREGCANKHPVNPPIVDRAFVENT